jgi:predicted HTH domain antitoxin
MFLHLEATMHAVNVRELKSNPSEALREAKHGPVVVMNRDRIDAVLIGIEHVGIADLPHVRQALAVSLFRGGDISVMAAAKVAGIPLAEMLSLLSNMQIPLYGGTTDEAIEDIHVGSNWLARS